MKKVTAIALVALCLTALCSVYSHPAKAQTPNIITINSDGTITPASVPIAHTGSVYTLTGNTDRDILVNESNVIVDGKGYSLYGGLSVDSVSNVTVKNFAITDGEDFLGDIFDGILLNDSYNITVANNTIAEIWSIQELNGVGYDGIDVEGGGSNLITGNFLLNDANGVFCADTHYNIIVDNKILDNESQGGDGSCGIQFEDAGNNTIYHNDFMDGIEYGQQASDGTFPDYTYGSETTSVFGTVTCVNSWDDGYPNGGNYWSDYWRQNPGAGEVYSSGILNMAYVIDSKNKDRYPLLNPFNSTLYSLETVPPKITILSPIDKVYNESSVSLAFTVDKTVTWMGYSLDGKPSVTITGNVTVANMTNGLHTLTVYANDTFGDVGLSNVSFTIAKPVPFPTNYVAAALVASSISIGVSLVIYLKKRRR